MAEEVGAAGPGPGERLVLDTHVWLWALEGAEAALSSDAVAAIEAASGRGGLLVSAISIWKVAMLEAKGRIALTRPVAEWVTDALRAPGVRLLPLTPEIAVESTHLPGSPHGDPADRILIASARVAGARLATCDRSILEYGQSGQVAVLDAEP